MKKYWHIALMLLCVFVVSSCKDDDDDTEAVEREAYKLEQDIAFQAKVNETGFVLCELFELQSEWIWFRYIWLDSCFATYG